MKQFTDLYEAYLCWKREGGYLADRGDGTFLIVDRAPVLVGENARDHGNDFGIEHGAGPPLDRAAFKSMYPELPIDPRTG